jgi:Skp family chaperone for outer membrane proteins
VKAFLQTATLCGFCCLAGAVEEPRIALVHVDRILSALPARETIQAQAEAARAAIVRDARAKAYQAAFKDLQSTKKALARLSEKNSDARRTAERSFNLKRHDALRRHEEFEAFEERMMQKIDAQVAAETKKVLHMIRREAISVGTRKGYDWVLDAGGLTNTGMPFVVFAKQPHDITGDVLESLLTPNRNPEQTSSN